MSNDARFQVTAYRPLLVDSVCEIEAALGNYKHRGQLPMVVSRAQYSRIMQRRAERKAIEEARIADGKPKDGRRLAKVRYQGRSNHAIKRHQTETSAYTGFKQQLPAIVDVDSEDDASDCLISR